MKPEIIVILAIFIGFILLEILFTQFFRKEKQVKGDGWVDLLSTLMLTGVTQPAVLFMGAFLATLIVPQYADVLKSWHWLPVLGLFLIFDDMTQYWWHRFTHRTPWLYNLHRPHHQAEYLSIRIVYRNNIFYYSTPATHSAHHGKHAADGVTNYKGNYGNLLFFWDILFGTAKITRQYPEEFGVENLPDTSVAEQLLWPKSINHCLDFAFVRP